MKTVPGYAKINLHLDVTGIMEDGYHSVNTVMQSLSLCDEVTVSLVHESVFDAECNVEGVPTDEKNIAVRAAKLYFETIGAEGGAHIIIEKRIPMAAGLAGGSADAAATLVALDSLFGSRLGKDKLCELGAKLGADVPFCLVGGTCRCEGVGEILTPFALKNRLWFVIAKPEKGVSTRALFSRLPLPRPRVQTLSAMAALAKGDLAAFALLMKNVLEPAAIELVPEIGALKQKLLDAGALCAQMTGSGSAVFGLFESEAAAQAALPSVSDAAFSTVCHSL